MTRFVQFGLGPLGQKLLAAALERKGFKLVAAVDQDPAKVGKDVAEILGLPKKTGVKVVASLADAELPKDTSLALVATVSSIARLIPQIETCAKAGLNVVSTCEELSYPWVTSPKEAKKIDTICKKAGVAALGTGVNPGYLMDYLPTVLTTACLGVEKIEVERVQDASHRRGPFQKKIGAGMAIVDFTKQVKAGSIRHVGLPESTHMLAAAMGWKLDKFVESIKPVTATTSIKTEFVDVRPGLASGVEQIAKGYVGSRCVIEMRFRATVGEPAPHDTVRIIGNPNINATIPGGVQGDVATCAVTINCAEALLRTGKPGLLTMLDIVTPRSVGQDKQKK
jgi:4-hydroxy-tetrahydrodipicolinate reductase